MSELFQAIEKKFPKYNDPLRDQNNVNTQRQIGAKLALNDPDLLRLCNPEIMKQSGWIRQEDYQKAIDGLKKCMDSLYFPKSFAQATLIDLKEL